MAKDLAIEYKYLSNTSEWFFNARKRANSLIEQGKNFKTGKIILYYIYISNIYDIKWLRKVKDRLSVHIITFLTKKLSKVKHSFSWISSKNENPLMFKIHLLRFSDPSLQATFNLGQK